MALEVESEVRTALAKLKFKAVLVAVRVGNDPASEVYVRNKAKKAKELGLGMKPRLEPLVPLRCRSTRTRDLAAFLIYS